MDDFFDSFKPKPKLIHTTRVVHHRKSEYDVFIGRPSKWGCPFTIIKDPKKTRGEFFVETRKEALDAYRNWIENGDGKHLLNDLYELKDKVLGCWCKDENGKGKSCHGDILIELIEKYCTND